MNTTVPNLIPLIPELFVLLMALVILMLGVFLPHRRFLPFYFAQITLVATAALTVMVFLGLDASTAVYTFHKLFVLDKLSMILKMFIYLAAFMSLAYSARYNDERTIPHTEFYVLSLLSVLGMMITVSSTNLITLYMGLELLSLPIYAMVALQRAKVRCVEAAMKYFVIGALASGMLLYGMSLLFGATKSLDISTIAHVIAATSIQHNMIMVFGLVFILAGLAFKLGAAPFHMWVPDVYDGAPTTVTLFLSSAPKIAAFGLIIRLLVQGMPSLSVQWSEMLIVVAILSMAIGNFAAIVQSNIKRMLAYSSIAHMGYMALGLICATPRGYSSALFYMLSYTIMTLGAFGMIILMSHAGFEANEIDDFAGLNDRKPWLAFLMLLIMFSMAGVPPIIGFIAKVGVFEALIQAHLVWLAVVAMLFAIVGAYYYIRVVKVMYFGASDKAMPEIESTFGLNAVMSVNGIAVLLLGIFPGALFALCRGIF